MLAEFLPQGASIQSQHGCSKALIMLGIVQHGFKKRLLYLVHHHVIKFTARLSIEGLEEAANCFARAVAQRWRA